MYLHYFVAILIVALNKIDYNVMASGYPKWNYFPRYRGANYAVLCGDVGEHGDTLMDGWNYMKSVAIFSYPDHALTLIIVRADGNLTLIGNDSMPEFLQLRDLLFAGQGWRYRGLDYLSIPMDFFNGTPLLEKLQIAKFKLDDSTLMAITAVSKTIKELLISNCFPATNVFDLIQNFTQLTHLRIQEMSGIFRPAVFDGSRRTLQQIHIINCEWPIITADVFAGMENLTMLQLINNNITVISADAFKDLKNLKSLILSGNRLQLLPVGLLDNLKNLNSFSFCNNQLKSVPSGFLSNNRQVQHISLAGNQLSTLPEDRFRYARELVVIDLSRNRIKILPDGFFNYSLLLDEVYLFENDVENMSNHNLSHLNTTSQVLRDPEHRRGDCLLYIM